MHLLPLNFGNIIKNNIKYNSIGKNSWTKLFFEEQFSTDFFLPKSDAFLTYRNILMSK